MIPCNNLIIGDHVYRVVDGKARLVGRVTRGINGGWRSVFVGQDEGEADRFDTWEKAVRRLCTGAVSYWWNRQDYPHLTERS